MNQNDDYDEVYKRMSQKEHILLWPDTYIGSTQLAEEEIWILNNENRMERKNILFSQGLFKIFDEIIVNAADCYSRD